MDPAGTAADAVDGGWLQIATNVLINIASRTSAATYATLRSVCRHWRLSIPAAVPHPHRLPPQIPFLLFPNHSLQDPACSAFSLATYCTYALRHLADTASSACFGSSYGWVFLLGPDCNVILRNPFTGDTFGLPSLDAILPSPPPADSVREISQDNPFGHRPTVRRAILSSDPSADRDFSAVLFLSEVKSRCFTWRSGEQSWTVREHPEFVPKEIIFIKDRLCLAIEYNGTSAIFDFAVAAGGDGFFTVAPSLPDSESPFLVESAGSVRLVTLEIILRREAVVRVYRLDFSRLPDITVIEEYDLGGRIFFLAHGNSMSVASTDFPGFEGDRIFFTKVDWNIIFSWFDTYVRTIWEVEMETGDSHLHDIVEEAAGCCPWPKPMWVPPNLHKKLGE